MTVLKSKFLWITISLVAIIVAVAYGIDSFDLTSAVDEQCNSRRQFADEEYGALKAALLLFVKVGCFVNNNTAGITVVGATTTAIFTGTLWFSTKRLWQTSKEAIQVSREIGQDQTRAYVHIERAELRWRSHSDKSPTITLIACNTGETPAKWFEVISRSFVRELDEDGFEKKAFDFKFVDLSDRKWKGWNSLGGKNELSFTDFHPEDYKEIQAVYGRKDASLHVAGIVRYETFFGEIFESEFWFTIRPIPKYSETEISRTERGSVTNIHTKENPHLLQRASCRMRTYDRVSP